MLKEAEKLYNAGFAVHWIKANSKAPVKADWTKEGRDDWDDLKKTYRKGFGLGVRLGSSSRLEGGGFLANIDVDIKSPHKKHRIEALKKLDECFPGIRKSAPYVKTGYGLRYFIALEKPIDSFKIAASLEQEKVLMPSAPINHKHKEAVKSGLITQAELDEGYRLRAAWELDFMSLGRQVILPPSIHPETKKPYIWGNNEESLDAIKKIPFIASDLIRSLSGAKKKSSSADDGKKISDTFEFVEVDLIGSTLSDEIVDAILTGKGVENRSDKLFAVAMAMIRAGFSDNEIMSVLTDRSTFLGEVAFEHRKTRNRYNAAKWIRDYTLKKAREETDAGKAFEHEVGVTPLLDDAAARDKQAAALTMKKHGENWLFKLERTGKEGDGPPAKTMKNVVLILENAVAPNVIIRDLFRQRDYYGCDVPWLKEGGKGKALDDDDVIAICYWLSKKYHFEPPKDKITDAVVHIAMRNGFHPIREELKSLAPWDNVPRIDFWLKNHFKAEGPNEYLAQVFRKWLVASIKRTFEPGAKFDWMIILEGGQGIGKSSFAQILFGEKYFSDWLPNLADKDAALGLQGMRVVEFSELDQVSKSELETTKAFIVRQIDKVRPPYGRISVEMYRQCVFIGTTNRERYLKDDSGNRRFAPVEVGELDFEALRRDRDQLWAEALFIYENELEEHLYIEGKAKEHLAELHRDKMVEDDSEFMLHQLERFVANEMEKDQVDRFNMSEFKVTDLWMGGGGPLGGYPQNGRSILFATKAMKKLGCIKHKTRKGNFWSFTYPTPVIKPLETPKTAKGG